MSIKTENYMVSLDAWITSVYRGVETHQHRGCWSRTHGWRTCWPAGPACCQSPHGLTEAQHEHLHPKIEKIIFKCNTNSLMLREALAVDFKEGKRGAPSLTLCWWPVAFHLQSNGFIGPPALSLFSEFGELSGYKLNLNKIELFPINDETLRPQKLPL